MSVEILEKTVEKTEVVEEIIEELTVAEVDAAILQGDQIQKSEPKVSSKFLPLKKTILFSP